MREGTFYNIKAFKQKVKAKNEALEEALKTYFESGGIIRVKVSNSKEWPELVYPSKKRINYLIKEHEKNLKELEEQKNFWEKKHKDAERYYLIHFFKKYTKKTYWKHLMKLLSDKQYREDAKKVNIPAHLVADKRWEPMIKTFVENEEYRKQLKITFEESPIYKKNKKLAKYSDQLLNFRKQETERKIKEINEKLNSIKKELSALKKIAQWAH
ncbi:MAG: hypothetical protein N3F05_01130 [Candidatus Diapherotrites archaeon]|nr:hypothetical protein [Candidatus Diapherotrites archaeon]